MCRLRPYRRGFFRFLQRCGRHDEFERPPDRFLRFPAAQRQPVAVDGDDRNRGILNLKQAAGMDGAGLIFADGKAGAADHGFQLVLRQADPLVGLDLRQLRVILGGHGRDGNEEMPPRMETLNFSSTEILTVSPGSFRMMSKKRREGIMQAPVCWISASTEMVMPVSRL